MSAIELLSPEEALTLTSVRATKSSPIRDALSALELDGQPLFVSCEEGSGYKKTTISQVIGRLNRETLDTRLTVKSVAKSDGTVGLAIRRIARDPAEAEKPKRGRKPGSKAKKTTTDEVIS